MAKYLDEMIKHYSSCWLSQPNVKQLDSERSLEISPNFRILEFPPYKSRDMWTYATCGMSQPQDEECIELHLFSPMQNKSPILLLTVVAHYHRTGQRLDIGHTVNFGIPWFPGSKCEYGIISLPYLDGPEIEEFRSDGRSGIVRCYWLIPITEAEVDFKKNNGLESLERKFQEINFAYCNPFRPSVV